jgi:aryl-alcohol dehydrogenase-like predicted oxidoreductase
MENHPLMIPDQITLGSTDIAIKPLGVGAWAWGDRFFWGYGRDYSLEDAAAAFQASIQAGIRLVDTAEVYGMGKSERLTGQFIRQYGANVILATKFYPYPWRFNRSQLLAALRGSLKRLGLESAHLYQIHWPLPPASLETWANALADAVQHGLTRAVGVSNFNRQQMLHTETVLVKRGVTLASNQVIYNLLNREVESNGLLETCRQHHITLIAYSPLAQGLLGGKYSASNPPSGIRGRKFSTSLLNRLPPLIRLLAEIGHSHGDKTPAQVALNWVMCKGAVPIPGAKNLRQAQENTGALGWSLTPDEIAALDKATGDLQPEKGT